MTVVRGRGVCRLPSAVCRVILAAGVACAAVSSSAWAQTYPAKFGRLVSWGDLETNNSEVPRATRSNECLGSKIPRPVSSIDQLFIDAAAGCCHTVALRRDGSVVAWGDDRYGRVSGAPTGTDNTGFIAVAAGWNHSMALKADGTLFLWGNNTDKQATAPSIIDPSKFPVTDVPIRFSAISAGEKISSGIVDMPEYPEIHGIAIVWGSVVNNEAGNCSAYKPLTNPFAQFGYGLSGVLLSNTDVVSGQIAAISGVGHHVLIKRVGAGGTIHGWGMNCTDGDGDHAPDSQSKVPPPLWVPTPPPSSPPPPPPAWMPPPTWVSTAPFFSTGHRTSYVLNSEGILYAWGRNVCGETGSGRQILLCAGLSPPAIKLPPLPTTQFRAVHGGYVHATGMLLSGQLIGWGYNEESEASPPQNTTSNPQYWPAFIRFSSTHFHGVGIRCYADVNGDGSVTTDDIADFNSARRSASPPAWTDCDGNGVINAADDTCFALYHSFGCFGN